MIFVGCMLVVFAIYQFTVSLITKYSTTSKHEAQPTGSGTNTTNKRAAGNSATTRYGKRKARLQRAGPIDEPTDFDHSAQCLDRWHLQQQQQQPEAAPTTSATSSQIDELIQVEAYKNHFLIAGQTASTAQDSAIHTQDDRASLAGELQASSMQTVIEFTDLNEFESSKSGHNREKIVNNQSIVEIVDNFVENFDKQTAHSIETNIKPINNNYYSRFQLKPKQADWTKAIKRVLNIEQAVKMFSRRQDTITDEEFLRRMELRNGDSPIEAGVERAPEPEFINSRKLRQAEISM